MRELLLTAVALLLATSLIGQAPSIAELDATGFSQPDHIVHDPIFPLYTSIQEVRCEDCLQMPLTIKQVPKTVYWEDRLKTALASEKLANKNNNKITSYAAEKKVLQFNPLVRDIDVKAGTTIRKAERIVELPFAIQQVNRTIYFGDRIEAYYAKRNAILSSKQEIEPEKKVVEKIEEEVVAVNSKTSSATNRLPIIDETELKDIVRRTKGKKSKRIQQNDKEAIFVKTVAERKITKPTKEFVKTKIPSTVHAAENVHDHEEVASNVKPRYNSDVVNTELAVLEKMIRADNEKKSNPTASNVNIPVTSQPLEVISQVINGESVITEIKPVTQPISATATGENRAIKAEHFSLKTIDNESINSNLLKGKVVVLNFWFTSCVECIREIPQLNDLKKRYENQDIEFVGICLNDKAKIESFLKKHPFEWKQIPDARQVAHDFYMFIYPGHAVVDKNGGIITLLNGNAPHVMQQLETAIQVGLGETF